MGETATSLRRFRPFAGLPAAALARLADAVQTRNIGKGQAVFEEGGAPEAVYALDDGLVKTVKYSSRLDPSGIDFIVPGKLFGMMAVLDGKPYPVSAMAARESVVLRLPDHLFRDLMKAHADFSRQMYEEMGTHLRNAQTLKLLMGEPAPKRIAAILLRLSEAADGKELKLLRQDLAEIAGCNFSTAVRTLTELKRRGIVSSGWKRIRVLRPDALAAEVERGR